MRETFKNIIREDLVESMKKMRNKTVLIWGSDDSITPLWIGKKMHETIKNSNLVTIENGTHRTLIDNPKQFIHAMGRMLVHSS